jgi:hypothetical protein
MSEKDQPDTLVLENVSRIEVELYDANTTTITLWINSDTNTQTLVMTGLHEDLATRLLNALAEPGTEIIHGDGFTSRYGDWVITEQVINKLTDEPQ